MRYTIPIFGEIRPKSRHFIHHMNVIVVGTKFRVESLAENVPKVVTMRGRLTIISQFLVSTQKKRYEFTQKRHSQCEKSKRFGIEIRHIVKVYIMTRIDHFLTIFLRAIVHQHITV